MARSDPARSSYCATRHLLRNLNDARQLRRNPLVREIFCGSDSANAVVEIRRRIEAALASLPASRGVAILVRADVQRHAPCVVSRDLGLSMRQYHRERKRAHDAFLLSFRGVHPRQPIAVDEDFGARTLRRASSLADSGEVESARAILEDAVRSGGDIRCDALVRLANIENWSHRFAQARELLHATEVLLVDVKPSRTSRILADAKDAATLFLRAFAEGPELLEHGDTPGDRTTIARADAAFLSGDARRAASLLQHVSIADAPFESVIDALIMQAELSNFSSPETANSEELFAQAIALAQSEGLHGRALYATHHLYATRWIRSRSAHDRASFRSLVDTIDPCLSPRLRMYLNSSAADVELAIGSPRRALQSAQSAAALSTSRYERLSAQALACAALFRLDRTHEASREAASTAESARSAHYPRIVSLAQRINAQALAACGRIREARTAIEESVECARGHSSAYVLAQANRIRAGIIRTRL